jgi:hypothetical protein
MGKLIEGTIKSLGGHSSKVDDEVFALKCLATVSKI